MIKRDKYSWLVIITTILFVCSVITYAFSSEGDVRNLAQVLIIIFASIAIFMFLISKLRQQRHLSSIFHNMVRTQTKLINDLEQLKASTPPAVMTHKAHIAEDEMRKTVIIGLAQARGEPLHEMRVPEPTNENMKLQDAGRLVIFEDDSLTSEGTLFSSIDPQQLFLEVRDALTEKRIEVLLQPVISLPQKKLRFYECFSRLRAKDGSILVPDRYIPVAAKSGLISAVDNALLFRCIQVVRKAKKSHVNIGFFCNLSESSLLDDKFMDSLMDVMLSNPDLKPWLILEIRGETINSTNPKIIKALKKLSKIKCTLSVDHVEAPDVNISRMTEFGIRFVKLDARELAERKAQDVNKLSTLLQQLEQLKINVIASKVESKPVEKTIIDLNVDYGQGFLFSRPKVCQF